MIGDYPVRLACGQHGTLHLGISLLTGAQSELGMNGACAKDGDIRPVAREQRKGGASGKQALFLIPLSTKQDQIDIFPIANLLGDIKRRGDDGQRSLQERGNGQKCASGVQKKRRARRYALRNLFTQPLLDFRQ